MVRLATHPAPPRPLGPTTRLDPRSSSCRRVCGVVLGGLVVVMVAGVSEGTQDPIGGSELRTIRPSELFHQQGADVVGTRGLSRLGRG